MGHAENIVPLFGSTELIAAARDTVRIARDAALVPASASTEGSIALTSLL